MTRKLLLWMGPSGGTWSGKSTNNQDLVLRCFGRLDVKGLHGLRSVHEPEGEHYMTREVTRRQLTQKTDADADTKTCTQREEINCVFLAFIKVCREGKCVCAFSKPPEIYL